MDVASLATKLDCPGASADENDGHRARSSWFFDSLAPLGSRGRRLARCRHDGNAGTANDAVGSGSTPTRSAARTRVYLCAWAPGSRHVFSNLWQRTDRPSFRRRSYRGGIPAPDDNRRRRPTSCRSIRLSLDECGDGLQKDWDESVRGASARAADDVALQQTGTAEIGAMPAFTSMTSVRFHFAMPLYRADESRPR